MPNIKTLLMSRGLSRLIDLADVGRWFRQAGLFYVGSAVVHIGFVIVLLFPWNVNVAPKASRPSQPAVAAMEEPEVIRFELGAAPVLPHKLSLNAMTLVRPPAPTEQKSNGSQAFDPSGPAVQPPTERAVAAALSWFDRHQNHDGSWSLTKFPDHCQGMACSGASQIESDSAATALALLTFLAVGETDTAAGPYRRTVADGVQWLLEQQAPDGDLSGQSSLAIDAHAMATLALCEAYGLTGDPRFGRAAQQAVSFIQDSQSNTTGGWQYLPDDRDDTAHWQALALHSAQRVHLNVNSAGLWKTGGRFQNVSFGRHPGFAVGRDDPLPQTPELMVGADIYRSFFVTQAMRRDSTVRWKTWNQRVRHNLMTEQSKQGCCAGSWFPEATSEPEVVRGGRILATSLAALTLAASYRHLPIHQLPAARTAVRNKE